MRNYVKNIDGISVKMLLSYFSILVLPLAAIIAIYFTATNTILEYQQEKAMRGLEETARIFATRIDELNNVNSYIQSDPMTNSIINRARFDQNKRDIYTLYQIITGFPSYQLTNQLIENVYIFFNGADFVAKLPNAFSYTEYNYNVHVNFYGVSYEEMRRLCGERHVGRFLVTKNDRGHDVLLLRSIPNSDTPDGLVALQLNQQAIMDILLTNETGPGGGAYILDGTGSLVAGVGNDSFREGTLSTLAAETASSFREIHQDGVTYLLYVYREAGLTYLSLVGKEHLLDSIAAIKYLILLLALVAAALGAVICIILWRQRRGVVRRISSSAQSIGVLPEGAKNEQVLIESTVNSLVNAVDTLRETLGRQKEILSQTVLRNLFHGAFTSRQEMNRELSTSGLELNAGHYHVVSVLLLEPTDASPEVQILPYRILIKEHIDSALEIPHLTCDMDHSSFALLLMEPEEIPMEGLMELIRTLALQIEGKDWVAPSFAVSRGTSDPWEIKSLYSQTAELRRYMSLLDLSGVHVREDMPQSADMLWFPVNEELRFIQLIKSGPEEDLEAFCSQLLEENLANRTLDAAMLSELCEIIRRSILRAIRESEQEDMDAIVDDVAATQSLKGLLARAQKARRAIARVADRQYGREFHRTKEELQRCIDENLSNPSFSLYMLSEAVGIPENTLYRSFKNYFSMSFSSYLEQCRINKAFELLRSQVLVKDVAEQVGYTSDHTFRRAFKRIMKVPPSQFAQ